MRVHAGVRGASSSSTLTFLLSLPWLEEASLLGSVIFYLTSSPNCFTSYSCSGSRWALLIEVEGNDDRAVANRLCDPASLFPLWASVFLSVK